MCVLIVWGVIQGVTKEQSFKSVHITLWQNNEGHKLFTATSYLSPADSLFTHNTKQKKTKNYNIKSYSKIPTDEKTMKESYS